MLLDLYKVSELYIVCGFTDLRKSIDGYASIIQDNFNINPMTDALYLFCNKQKNKLKILYWDKDGFWLLYKRLEKSKFRWPKTLDEIKMISKKQLEWLLEGLEIEQKYYHQEVKVEIA
ncbi:MAG: IS66 family insertion sequence element accessory protein TnpB [Bacilli bacterium]